MNYKKQRERINTYLNNKEVSQNFLKNNVGIDVTKNGKFKVRPEERTPSCLVNRDGSYHDYGSGQHYSDVVSLLYDGYHAFNTLPETMAWVCSELGINMEEVYYG